MNNAENITSANKDMSYRNNQMENTITAMAKNNLNVFLYYPQAKVIWLPDSVAEFFKCPNIIENVPEFTTNRYIAPENRERYKQMFKKIDEGADKVSETILYPGFLRNFTISLTVSKKDEKGNPIAVIGQITPTFVEDERKASYDLINFSISKDVDLSDITMTTANVLSSLFYAIYHIWMNTGAYICCQEKLPCVLDIVGSQGNIVEGFEKYINNFVCAEDQQAMTEFTCFDTLSERLSDCDKISTVYRRKDIGWLKCAFIVAKRDADGKPLQVMFLASDNNDEMLQRKQLTDAEYAAIHDGLTNVYTRSVFENILKNPHECSRKVGMLILDIDYFKEINDNYGHETGDKCLRLVASELTDLFRNQDLIIRLGGDEFAVLLQNCSQSGWTSLCQKLSTLHTNLQNAIKEVPLITVSCGVCFSDEGISKKLYTQSDKALYHMKAIGRKGCTMSDMGGNIVAVWREKAVVGARLSNQTVLMERAMLAMLENTKNLSFVKNKKLNYVIVSENFAKNILGLNSASEAVGKKYAENSKDTERARRVYLSDKKMLEEGIDHMEFEDVLQRTDNTTNYGKIDKYLIRDKDGSPIGILGYCQDITRQIDAEKELHNNYDRNPLTGLYNRSKTFAECRKMLTAHPDEKFAIMHFDIKQFKLYNTFFGEEAGNKLLCDLADKIRDINKTSNENWIFGHIGGDVFCLFYSVDHSDFNKYIPEIIGALSTYRKDFLIECAVGIYNIPDNSMPVETMFARASIAAKATKATKEQDVVYFNDSMEKSIKNQVAITSALQEAINKEQFKVYMQPKYSLFTHKIVGAEALVRWIHPIKGLVSPSTFIPALEDNGYISLFDHYMWEHVCMILKRQKDNGFELLPVSVNVSRISMYRTNTVPFLKSLVHKYGVDPKYMQLELTESSYMDNPEELKKQLRELRDFGFQILIDDFGSGFSSLNTLRELPVDIVKLDMKFLPDTKADERGCAVLSSIVDMSHKLHLRVIAEGVETKEQAALLKDFNCEYVQGFMFAKPMPLEEYEKLLKEQQQK